MWLARERGGAMVRAAIENKYGFDMEISVSAMARSGRRYTRRSKQSADASLDQTDQWLARMSVRLGEHLHRRGKVWLDLVPHISVIVE